MAIPVKYMAAPVPRYMRAARLSYLSSDCVISSWAITSQNNISLVYDVIMLPEEAFIRARSYLAVPALSGSSVQPYKTSTPYVPENVKEIIIPQEEKNPARFAKQHFMNAFEPCDCKAPETYQVMGSS